MTPAAAASAFLGRASFDGTTQAIGSQLLQLAETARQRWPDVEVDPARFFARLGELTGGVVEQLEALHVADLWLAIAAGEGERAAHVALEHHALRRVSEALRRRGVDEAERDEIAQLLRAEVLVGTPPRILAYAGRAPLERWLIVVAARLLDRVRRRASKLEPFEEEEVVVAPIDLEQGLLRAEAKHALGEALRRAVHDLEPDDRVLLRLHVNDHLGIDEIAQLYAIHRATASRRLARARRELAKHTRRHLVTTLSMPPWEVDSLIRVVRSSFRSLVGTYLATTSK
jgi:RNA polymerase sigma-70 factor (ECF subfamily)